MKKTGILLLTLALLLAAGCAKKPEPVAMDAAAPSPDAAASAPESATPAPYTNVRVAVRRGGETVSERDVSAAEEIEAARQIVFDYMVKSAAWEGVEVSELSDCVELSFDQGGAERQIYYQFDSDGRPVLQYGETGMYTVMSDDAYASLMQLAGLAQGAQAQQDAPQPDAPQQGLPAAYAAIVAQYADAMQNGYYESLAMEERDAAFGEAVATEWKINPQPAYYALADLDGDGVSELLLGAGEDPAALGNYDIWCLAGEQAVRPFDMDFGYRVNFEVYADGVIELAWSNSAFESGYDYYRISGGTAQPAGSLVATFDAESERMQYQADGAEIDEATFNQRLQANETAGKLPLDWTPVTAG